MNPDKRDQLYDNLINSGLVTEREIGDRDAFKSAVKDEASARQFYGNLTRSGLFKNNELGSEDDFYKSISSDFGGGAADAPATKPQATAANVVTGGQLDSIGKEIDRANGAGADASSTGAQDESMSKAAQRARDIQSRVEIPAGYGQWDMSQGRDLSNGAVFNDPLVSRIKDIGAASRGDTEALARTGLGKAATQMKEQLDYTAKTGKMLRSPLKDKGLDQTKIGLAPTVARDENGEMQVGENGEPIIGQVSDSQRARSQYAMEQKVNQENRALELKRAEEDLARLSQQLEEYGGTGLRARAMSATDLYQSGLGAPVNRDERKEALMTAYDQALERVKGLQTEMSGGQRGFWNGLVDTASDPSTWMLGFDKLPQTVEMFRVSEKLKRGESLTDEETEMLRATMGNQGVQSRLDEGSDWLYRAGRTTMEMVPFMAQIGATGGFGGVAGVGQKMGTKAMQAFVREYGADTAAKRTAAYIIRNTGVALGDMAAGYAAANTVGAANTLNDILERRMGNLTVNDRGDFDFEGGESWLNSILKGETSQAIEFATERFGEHLPGLSEINRFVASKKGLSGLSKVLSGLEGNAALQQTMSFLNKFGIQGIPSEVIEEEMGIVLNSALTGDATLNDLVDAKTQGDIWGGLALSVGLMGAMTYGGSKVVNTAGYYKYKRAADKASRNAELLLGDRWEEIRDRIDASENKDMNALLDETRKGADLTLAQKQAVMNYATDLLKMRGYNLGMMFGAREAMKHPELLRQNEEEGQDAATQSGISQMVAEDEGYNAPQEDYFVMAQTYLGAREAVENAIGGAALANLESNWDDMTEAERGQVVNGLDAATVDALNNYMDARSRIDGALARVRDDAEDATKTREEAVRIATNNLIDGSSGDAVNTLTIGTIDGNEVYVLGNTGNTMFVIDPNTLEKQVVPESKVENVQVVDAAGYVESMREQAQGEAERNADWALTHHPKTKPIAEGTEIPIALEGGEGRVIVTRQDGDNWEAVQGEYDAETGTWKPKGGEVVQVLSGDQLLQMQDEFYTARDLANAGVEEEAGEGGEGGNIIPAEETGQGAVRGLESQQGQQPQRGQAPVQGEGQVPVQGQMPQQGQQGQELQQGQRGQMPQQGQASADADAAEVERQARVQRFENDDFSGASAEEASGWLFDEAQSGLTGEEADAYVEAKRKEAAKNAEKLEGKAPKMGTNIAEYKRKKAEWQAQQEAASQSVKFWDDVKQQRDRKTGRDLFDEDARFSQELQQAISEAEGNREAMRRLMETEPETLEEIAADMLANGSRVMWADEELDGTRLRGASAHTGYSREDVKRMPFVFASHERGGMSVDAFGEAVLQEARDRGIRYDEDDAMAGVNALLSVLGSVRTQGDINNYVARNRIRDAREILRQDEIAREEYEREQAAGKAGANAPGTVASGETAAGELPFVPEKGMEEAAAQGAQEEAAGREAAREEMERRRQSGATSYQLSNEVDENGRQFVLSSNGTVEFGSIDAASGLTQAPILLSEGMITNPETNDGYGLVHIEARHGDQIRKAGYASVLDFIEDVSKNYEIIRRGSDRSGNPTYMLLLTDKHNNTLMVELSGDGTYWNINTAGIFKTSYGADRAVVYNRHTTVKQPAEAAEESLSGEQSGTTPSTSMDSTTQQSAVSDSKGSESAGNEQGNGERINKDSQSGNRLVTDEQYEELRRRLKAKFGQLNAGLDPETAILTGQMMVYHIERGVRKLVEVAKKLVEDFGDAVRPYLRSSYEWARAQMEDEGVSTEGMTPYDEARKFDAANFDKAVPDVMETANVTAAENELAKKEREEKPQETEKRDSYNAGERVVLDEDGKVYRVEYITTEGDVVPGQQNSYVTYYHLDGKPYNKYTADQLSGIKRESKEIEETVKKIKEIANKGGRKAEQSGSAVSLQPQEPDLFSQASGNAEEAQGSEEAGVTSGETAGGEEAVVTSGEEAGATSGEAQGSEEAGVTSGETAGGEEAAGEVAEKLDGRLTKEGQARIHFMTEVATDLMTAVNHPENGRPYKGIKDLREAAKKSGMYVDEKGSTDILLQELVEEALVRVARLMIKSRRNDGRTGRGTFEAIKRLYEMQPNIGQRSSERVRMQQYSTPLPMAFVADMWAYRDGMESVLEPTAGNGMLVIGVPKEVVHANELDKTRLDVLRRLTFKKVTSQDATQPFSGQYDSVIMNPPFGSAEAKEYDGVMIEGLDPQITLNALASMKDDGTAAIIIGGNMEYAPNGAIKNKRDFFCYLYDHYNVAGVVDMAGGLYARQGTTYPTRMILINGRRSEEERAQTTVYPPVQERSIEKVTTFDELYDKVLSLKNSNKKTNGTEILRTQTLPLDGGERHGGRPERNRPPVEHNANDGNERGRRELSGSVQDTGRDASGGVRRAETQRGIVAVRPGDASVSGAQEREGGRSDVSSRGRGGVDGLSGRNGLGELSERGTAGSRVGLTGAEDEAAVPQRTEEKKREISDEKLPYRQHNTAFSLESVAPAAMVEAMDENLKKLENEVGNIEEWLAKELGYGSINELHKALAGEQVDSVAMAIYQMKQGQALIIGDQTGVGKGRQMAALIRWAVKQGKKPIFMTQKAELFTDIYRDLVAVGSGELRPFILNNDGAMLDADGNNAYSPLSRNKQNRVMEAVVRKAESSGTAGDGLFNEGEDPLAGYDYIVLTYSQVNKGDAQSRKEAADAAKASGKRSGKKQSSKAEENPLKAQFVRAMAKDNYLMLDESHTAAGESNQGAYIQSIVKTSKAVTFASATYAKRPDTMPLYALRTVMGKANVEASELIEVIQKGGVTLQEIMSRALTAAGQMVRRERDMSDVETDWKTIDDPAVVARSRENYDKTIEAFNDIIAFQEAYIKPFIDKTSKDLAVVAARAGLTKGTEHMGVQNVPFASKTYNYTKQLMLALKVDAIIDEVVKEIKAGRHPVIALESTMESAYDGYSPGDVIEEPTFAMSLLKGLDSVMSYTQKNGGRGKEMKMPITPQQLGPAGEQAYYELREKIRQMTSGVFISPLDAIIDGLQARGYRVGELTGRNTYLERQEDGSVIVRNRRKEQRDKKALVREFNGGEVDVLILNKSASTGISLHASSEFSDRRQRSMVIAQPLSDINDYMQMIGRIDRTGQVHRGYYINLGLPVPAEQRFLMMLSTKLKSLNANTTTSQDNEDTDVEAPDLLNKYGSQVVVEYLRDNKGVYEQMGEPLKKGNEPVSASGLDDFTPSPDDEVARKITGYVALLPTEQQEAFYTDVIRRYTELIQYLNETESNDLKITVMPLRAETLEKKVSSKGVDPTGDNPFAQNAYWERVMVDVLRKPMKASDVRALIDKLNKPATNVTSTVADLRAKTYSEEVALRDKLTDGIASMLAQVDADKRAKLDKEEERYEKARAKMEESIAAHDDKIRKSTKMSESDKEEAIRKFRDEAETALDSRNFQNKEEINRKAAQMRKGLKRFKVGGTYLIPDTLDGNLTFDYSSPGIFCGYKSKSEGLTESTTFAVFATLDGRKRVEVKLSAPGVLQAIEQHTMQNYDAAQRVNLDNWDEMIPTSRRKEAYILTGNIIQALSDSQGSQGGFTGQLISFTDVDGNVRDGVLMPDKWSPTQLRSAGVPINARMADIRAGKVVKSTDNKVVIGPDNSYRVRGVWYDLAVPKTKKEGAKFYQNADLIRLVTDGNFYERGGMFHGQVHFSDLQSVLDILSQMGVRVKETKSSDADASDTEVEDSGVRFRGGEDVEENAGEDNVRYREVTDAETLERLEKEPTIKVYRAMQLIDGKLYPPMSAKVNGELRKPSELGVWEEAEENPELADDKGYFKLDKGNKKGLKARYNPYIHTSATMLNDQFSEAQSRDNLVVVETEVPESELTSGYKAEKAKDAVGLVEWKAGIIQGQLTGTRAVVLSRWAKPVRIVPADEVGESIAKMLEGTGIVMPSNVVTPQQRAALEARGVPFVETDNTGTLTEGENAGKKYGAVYGRKATRGRIGQGAQEMDAAIGALLGKSKGERAAYTARAREQAKKAGEALADKLGLKVAFVDAVPDEMVANMRPTERKKAKRSKGWYDSRTGRIVVVVGNHGSADDVLRTVLHEGVAHHGLRELFGKDFDTFLDNVYNNVDSGIKREIDRRAKANGMSQREATEEYLASLAEDTNFEQAMAQGWWTKIKNFLLELLRKVGVDTVTLEDADLRYMLYRSYENLKLRKEGLSWPVRDIVTEANDVSTRRKLGVMEFERGEEPMAAEGEASGRTAGGERGEGAESEASGRTAGGEGGEGVRFRAGGATTQSIAREEYERALGRILTRVKEIAQDKWQSVLEGVRAVEKESGERVKEYENPYMAMVESSSSASSERERYERGIGSEFTKAITDATTAMQTDDTGLDDYVYAKHAMERNRVVAFRDAIDYIREAYQAATGHSANEVYEAYMSDPMRATNNVALTSARRQYLDGTIDEDAYWREYEAWARVDDMLREQCLQAAADKLPMKVKAAERYQKNRETDYSGLSWLFTDEAEHTTEEMEEAAFRLCAKREKTAKGNNYDVEDLWDSIRAISKFGLDKNYQGGLISKSLYDYVNGMFDYYVPLQGWDTDTAEDVYTYSHEGALTPSGGIKRIKGRRSKAAYPLATLYTQSDHAISVGYRNLAKQSLLRMAENHHTDLLSVSRLWYEWDPATKSYKVVDYATGAGVREGDSAEVIRQKYEDFEQRMKDLQRADREQRAMQAKAGSAPTDPEKYALSGESADIPIRILRQHIGAHQVVVKRGGINYIVTVNGNPRLAQAINGELSGKGDSLTKAAFRTVAALQTSLNPNFVVPNAVRDAGFGFATSYIREGRPYARSLASHIAKEAALVPFRLKRYLAGEINDSSDEGDKLFKEFMENGGETSYKNNIALDEYVRVLERAAREASGDRSQLDIARDGVSMIKGGIEFLARWSELTSRFSAFRASKDIGRSTTRAVYDAKQLTANFDKKGSGVELLDASKDGAWYYFGKIVSGLQDVAPYFNAAMQGFASTLDAAYGGYDRNTGSGGRAMIAASKIFISGAVLTPLLNAAVYALSGMMGGDSDDDDKDFSALMKEGLDKYYERPFYDRKDNFVLFGFKAPLSPEVRAIYGCGDILTECVWRKATGRYINGDEMALRVANQFGQFLPLNPTEGGRGIMPIPVTSYFNVEGNEAWNGRPIYKKSYERYAPKYTLSYDQDALLTRIARALNNATKGEHESQGLIDINPAAWEYMLRQNFGGAYQIPSQMVTLATKIAKGDLDAIESRDIPILNRFWTRSDGRSKLRMIDEEYYDNKDILDEFAYEVKRLEKEGNNAAADKLRSDDLWSDYQEFKLYEKDIREARKSGNEKAEYLYKSMANDVCKKKD